MKTYKVHIYREMCLFAPGIVARTAERPRRLLLRSRQAWLKRLKIALAKTSLPWLGGSIVQTVALLLDPSVCNG